MLGCTLEPYIITAEEQYTRNFIKDFGLIDPNQDWNLAKEATVSINLGDGVCSSVKVYGKVQDTYYLVADLTDISGTIEVPVDVPESCNDFLVKVNNRKFYGKLGETINCADLSRGVPGWNYSENNNTPEYTKTDDSGCYSIIVKHTNKGNGATTGYDNSDGGAYQYFNTQQMSPIIATKPWTKYFSINLMDWSLENTKKEIGLLPESGVFNRKKKELDDWLDAKEAEGKSIVEDFKINTGDDGSFTLFPYYYGTNLIHELGVYLLDAKGNPILTDGREYDDTKASSYTLKDFISFPIFENRNPGDLQIQPHYDKRISDIKLSRTFSEKDNEWDDNWVFNLGEETDLEQYVMVKVNGTWMKYSDYICENRNDYHSRVAYHFWVYEPFADTDPDGIVYAKISNDGIVTPLVETNTAQDGQIAIATEIIDASNQQTKVNGVEFPIKYTVQKVSGIQKIEIKEERLNMMVGDEHTLDVTLKDKNGNVLDWNTYYDQISVTGDWNTDICRIYKDDNKKEIKILAVGEGDCWPRVYETTHNWNGIFDNVHISVSSHSYIKEHNEASDVISLEKWQEYFSHYNSVEKNIMSNVEISSYGGSIISGSDFSDIDDNYSIIIELQPASRIYLAYNWNGDEFQNEFSYKVGDAIHTSEKFITQKISNIEVPVQDWMVSKLKSTGLLIHSKEEYTFRVNNVTLKRPEGTYWIQDGKSKVRDYLVDKYKTLGPTSQKCIAPEVLCNANHDFSNVTPTIEIMDDAGYNNIHYKVKWTIGSTNSSNAPIRKGVLSHTSTSRAESGTNGGIPKLLESNGKWQDVKAYWSRYLPGQEEVASYPVELPMLARSRGYDIKLYVKKDNVEKPYVGYLGMYLKMTGSYWIDNDGNEQKTDKNHYSNTGGYVVFSQKKFNRSADNQPYPQTSALSVKHPLTGRTFLTFEDMLVAHEREDYKQYEYSSDRDVNDLIFNITNYGSISNDKESITETTEKDETISWLWAVEDLGATDDFDFNDMVMKITSVTKSKTDIEYDADGKVTSSSTVTLYKKVTFTPLCAGGTLPLYVQFTPKEGTTYVLKPGFYMESSLGYNINDSELTSVDEVKGIDLLATREFDATTSEIHKWFGNGEYPSTMMINTSGSGAIKAKSCVLYLKNGFSIAGFGSSSLKGPQGGLTVYVNDDRQQQTIDDITDGTKGWTIGQAETGKVSQMFMIYDANTKWRWPSERTHILKAYPEFKKWVNDGTNTEWFNGGDKNCTIPRYDLGETE